MKFTIDEYVKFVHTVEDGRIGKVVGIFSTPIFCLGPQRTKFQCDEWAKLIPEANSEDIMQQPLYLIKFDKPLLNFPIEKIREDMRDKFPDEAEFMRWVETTQMVRMVTTPESDLESAVPSTVEELLDNESVS